MSNQMSEGDFDSIIENELVEASEDEMDAGDPHEQSFSW